MSHHNSFLCSYRLVESQFLCQMDSQITWSRLIRFMSEEDDCIHFGDAVLSPGIEGIYDVEEPLSLQARIITGNPLKKDYKVAKKLTPVKRLLGPLTPELVPDIRCIGGNYASHCMILHSVA